MADVFTGRVAVIGLGYIGLPTAAVLATRGIDVVGVDVNAATVAAVARGEVPFVEPDLGDSVAEAVSTGRLVASTTMPEADAFVIAVPTPFNPDRTADLTYVMAAVESIAGRLRGGEVVVLESTSPPGTTRLVSERLAELRPDLVLPHQGPDPDVFVAHCPERVLPGRIMIEMVINDRVVGGISPACGEVAASLYRVFCEGQILVTDAASAEMAKLVENAYRDVNIAFANELSMVCDTLGLDVWEVMRLANHHPRVNVLRPGPGVGGHCIAVDPWFIVSAAPEQARLMRTAREVNDAKPGYVADQVAASVQGLTAPTIACLGLAYKANIDDLRESPAIDVVSELRDALPDALLLVCEPYVTALPSSLEVLDGVRLVDLDEALEAAGHRAARRPPAVRRGVARSAGRAGGARHPGPVESLRFLLVDLGQTARQPTVLGNLALPGYPLTGPGNAGGDIVVEPWKDDLVSRSVGRHSGNPPHFTRPLAPRAKGAHRASPDASHASWSPGRRWSAVVVVVLTLLGGMSVASSSARTPIRSLWSNSVAPRTPADVEVAAVELGTRFQTTQPGTVTALRYYRFSSSIGPNTGTLWDSQGRKLASVTFTGQSSQGWQRASLATPVTLRTGTTYVVSYTSGGHYAGDQDYFTSGSPYTSGPLVASAGVYKYGSGFPTSTYRGTNYYADIEFIASRTTKVLADPTPTSSTRTSPTPTTTTTSSPTPTTTTSSPTPTVSSTPTATPTSSPTTTRRRPPRRRRPRQLLPVRGVRRSPAAAGTPTPPRPASRRGSRSSGFPKMSRQGRAGTTTPGAGSASTAPARPSPGTPSRTRSTWSQTT